MSLESRCASRWVLLAVLLPLGGCDSQSPLLPGVDIEAGHVLESGVPPAFLATPDAASVSLSASPAEHSSQTSAPQELGPLGIVLLGLTAVNVIQGCARPLYNDIQKTSTVSNATWESCITVAVEEGVSYIVGTKVTSMPVTQLRTSIRGVVGPRISRSTLQSVVNKQTKKDVGLLAGAIAGKTFTSLLSGLKSEFDRSQMPWVIGYAPVVTTAGPPPGTLKVGKSYTHRVSYTDEDGDVSQMEFAKWTGRSWSIVTGMSLNTIGTRSGTISYSVSCTSAGSVRGRVTLADRTGLRTSQEYAYVCSK